MSNTTKNDQAAKLPADIPLDLDMDCRGCGSAEHAPYVEVRNEPIDGQLIVWKRTSCSRCGQHRINRFSRPLARPAGNARRKG